MISRSHSSYPKHHRSIVVATALHLLLLLLLLGGVGVEVDGLDGGALLGAVADEVAEVAGGYLALAAGAEGLLAARKERLDRVLQAHAQVVRGDPQHLAHRSRDARAVRVHVVDRLELRRYLGCQTLRQRLRDLLQHVGCHRDDWRWKSGGLVLMLLGR